MFTYNLHVKHFINYQRPKLLKIKIGDKNYIVNWQGSI